MGDTILHDTNTSDALDKIDTNIAKAEAASKQRAEERAAKRAEREKQHADVVEQIGAAVQENDEYKMV